MHYSASPQMHYIHVQESCVQTMRSAYKEQSDTPWPICFTIGGMWTAIHVIGKCQHGLAQENLFVEIYGWALVRDRIDTESLLG